MLHYLQGQVLPERSVQGRKIFVGVKVSKSYCEKYLFFLPLLSANVRTNHL